MILVAYLNQVGAGSLSASASAHVTAMIEQSSDPDANAVISLLNDPQSQLQKVAQDAGMTGFKLNLTGDALYWLGQSQITARDFAKFFSKIDLMIPQSQRDFAFESTFKHNAASRPAPGGTSWDRILKRGLEARTEEGQYPCAKRQPKTISVTRRPGS